MDSRQAKFLGKLIPDRVMRDGKSGCRLSERKRKVGDRGLRQVKNECYGAEQR